MSDRTERPEQVGRDTDWVPISLRRALSGYDEPEMSDEDWEHFLRRWLLRAGIANLQNENWKLKERIRELKG